MKKQLFWAAALGMMLSACEDVPAPYEIFSEGGQTSSALLEESFATSLGSFTSVSVVGDYAWASSYSCAQITAYVDNQNHDAEAWLVSPAIDATDVDTAYISFEYILRYALASTVSENHRVLVSTDYAATSPAGEVGAANWVALDFSPEMGNDWNTWYDARLQIPQEMLGSANLRVALCYKATTAKAGTWEVRNIAVRRGLAPSDNTGGGEPADPDAVQTLPYSETFATSLGSFKNELVDGAGQWVIDYSTAKATGYNNSVNEAGTYYLVSPPIDLQNVSEAHISYEYILRYDRGADNTQLVVSADYADGAATATWTSLKADHKEGTNWSDFETADVQVPAAFLGKVVRVAYYFHCSATASATWEVKNFRIAEGKAAEGGSVTPGGDVQPDGDNLVGNGGFEVWNGSTPANWKTATSAGNATLSQSTEARSGAYSVCVGGTASANKRLAYQETRLKAGTYLMHFYTKAATSAGGSVRPGYVPVADGSAGSYVYGSYVNDLTTAEWVEVSHTFTLDAETEVCLVVMNSKNPGGDVLIDDFTLTTSDGGLAEGGNVEPTPGDEPGAALYSIDFKAGGQGDWTIDDRSLDEGLSYVWNYDTRYGMKASAFVSSANHPAESWLLSPAIDLSQAQTATLTLHHAGNYFNGIDPATLLGVYASADGATWTALALSAWPTNWTFIDSTADLSAFAGKAGVRIACKYTSTSETAPTWEIEKLSITQ